MMDALRKMWLACAHVVAIHTYIKFIYSEKATKFCQIPTLLLTGTTKDKNKVEILQNFVAFSEYMKFI